MLENFLGSNLIYLRAKHGKTQSDIGLQVDKGHTTIGNWENGKNLPSANDVYTLSQYFDIIADDLMFKDLRNEGYSKKSEIKKSFNNEGNNEGIHEGESHVFNNKSLFSHKAYLPYKDMSEKDLEYELSIEIERLNDLYKDFKKLTEIVHLLNATEWLKNKFPLVPDYKKYKQEIEEDFEEMHGHLTDKKLLKALKIVDLYQETQEHVRNMTSKLIDYIHQYSDSILLQTVRDTKKGKGVLISDLKQETRKKK
ncbi:MAG: helix-turn-helix transcriptional regulator [Chitinophagaceae bacterium]